jgi:uncharacterized protein YprB with RNaseH-like and TPR domain
MTMSSADKPRKPNAEAIIKQMGGKLHRASEYFKQEQQRPCHPPVPIEQLVTGTVSVSTSRGVVVQRQLELPMESTPSPRGYVFPTADYVEVLDAETLAALGRDPALASCNLERIVFLDVETTGLAGGTGTYPFLVGLGYFRSGHFTIEQYFMEDFDQELALMSRLGERMAEFEALVTYNGKRFDIPLLRTRFIYNRLPSVWELPHLDLLHLARRLWRKRLPKCSLDSIEQNILGIERLYDIDGSLVPQVYFDYVRGLRRERIIPVFDHNTQDVISMAALLVKLGYYYRKPSSSEINHAFDLIGLSHLFEHNGLVDQAVECMERALLFARDEHLSHLITSHIAKIYKRQNRWEEAIQLWQAQIAGSYIYNWNAFVELAKYYEHRARDHARAQEVVMQALKYLEMQRELDDLLGRESHGGDFDVILEDLQHRLNRLKRYLDQA